MGFVVARSDFDGVIGLGDSVVVVSASGHDEWWVLLFVGDIYGIGIWIESN